MKTHNAESAPCKHMEAILQQLADGSATGIKKFYAVAHASRCHRCGSFLDRLRVTLDVLRESKRQQGSAPEEALARLRDKICQLENNP